MLFMGYLPANRDDNEIQAETIKNKAQLQEK